MTAPETVVPAEQEAPAGEHPYEFPPPLPLRLAGHVGGRIISERPEWAYLADPPSPDATEAVLAEWRAALVRNLPVRRAVPAEPEMTVPAPAPQPVVPPSARLAALPEPAPTPAHAGSRRPLFGRRRHDGDRLDEMAGEFAEPAEREHAGVWPRPGQDGPGPSEPVPPPAEEVMPDDSGRKDSGHQRADISVPRPAPAQRGETPEAGTVSDGPGHPKTWQAGPGLYPEEQAPAQTGLPPDAPRPGQDAEGSPPPSITGPGCPPPAAAPEAEDDPAAAAVQHAAEEALRRAGVKQEDLDALAKPGDGRDATTEMTEIIERPQEQQ